MADTSRTGFAERTYSSSWSSMACEFALAVFAALFPAAALGGLTAYDRGEWETFLLVWAAGILLATLAVAFRRTTVIVTETGVTIRYVFREVFLSRAEYDFSAKTDIRALKGGLKAWSGRSLTAHGDAGDRSFPLRNFQPREYSLLMADLHRPPQSGTVADERLEIEFTTPKAAIVREHLKMTAITFLACVGGAVIVAGASGEPLIIGVAAAVLYLLLFSLIGFDLIRVAGSMPRRIAIDNESIVFGNDAFRIAPGLGITATPPEYGKKPGLKRRVVRVRGAWGESGRYSFSLCPDTGNERYVYAGYDELCFALERASRIHGFLMAHDW